MTRSLVDGDVQVALDAFAELPDWLAVMTAPGRVAESLRRVAPELTAPGTELTGATVERVRAKGTEWLVRCLVRLVRDGQPSEVVLVGRLLPPGAALPLEEPTVPFGEPGWRCSLPDLRLQLEVEVADAALPALPRLVDADSAATFLQQVLRGAGHEVAVAGCTPEVVQYKPGSRCTIVYRMDYRGTPGPDPLAVKTYSGEKGRTAWEAMHALWASPAATSDVVTLAEPLAYLPDERVLVQGPVPEERTLKVLVCSALMDGSAERLDGLRKALRNTAVALAALHVSGAEYGGAKVWEEELAEVREVLQRLAHSVPHLGSAADPLLRRLAALHATVPPDAPVSAHRTFRPAQVLLHGGRIGFIDFDSAGRAEPALDLGRFRAALREIGISAFCASGRPLAGAPLEHHLRLLDELCDDFLDAYRDHAPVAADRVVLWETTDLLTSLLHSWTKVRTDRVGSRLVLVRHAAGTAPALLVS
jgi:Ser/Thr protein kinase RdoA (MazF antagonist)